MVLCSRVVMSSCAVRLLTLLTLACVASAFDIRQHLASKSPYWRQSIIDEVSSLPAGETCELVHVDLVSRHGSREPLVDSLDSLNALASKVQKFAPNISANYAWLKNWTDPIQHLEAGYLTYAGELELYGLAQRFRARFSSLLNQTYWPYLFNISSTFVPRAGVSASSFTYGLFEEKGQVGKGRFEPTFIWTNPLATDNTLRFFDTCTEYVKMVDDGTIPDLETDKYKAQNYPPIATKVAERLGLASLWNISVKELGVMFSACANEVANQNVTNRWCSLFLEEDILTYEFSEDLSAYSLKSYGNPMNYEIAAPLIQELVSIMTNISQHPNPTRAHLRFAHAETVLPLLSALGLFKDDFPLSSGLSPEQLTTRKWRSSQMAPFAANVAFALYNCSSGFRVKVLHNEGVQTIPGCPDAYCPLSDFVKAVAPVANYDFDAHCFPPVPVINESSGFSGGVVVVFSFVGFVLGAAFSSLLAAGYVKRLNPATYIRLRGRR